MQSQDEWLQVITENAPQWLQEHKNNSPIDHEQLKIIIACYKPAALAKLIPLGGECLHHPLNGMSSPVVMILELTVRVKACIRYLQALILHHSRVVVARQLNG